MSPRHKASNLAAFLALLARLMTSSSVSSLWCPLASVERALVGSAKCRAWKDTRSCERSLITSYLYNMPSHNEESLRAVDFHITFTAVGHIASDYDVKAGASRGEFCVAVEVAYYLHSPQRYLAVCIYTVIQVDACVRVCA